MATKIEWADESWNPVTGCTRVSEGCKNCYAERMSKRLAGRFGYPEKPDNFQVTLHPDRLSQPLRWDKKRMIFVCSMGDLFHPDVPDEFIDQVFKIMMRAYSRSSAAKRLSRHIFMVLTKRPERMKEYIVSRGESAMERGWLGYARWPIDHVWLGVSAENQEAYDRRVLYLLQTPAAVRFVSLEPLLGHIDLRPFLPGEGIDCSIPSIDWVITGGETGPGSRSLSPWWFRKLREQCVEFGVPFFFKQWGGPHKPGWVIGDEVYSGRQLDGREWNQYPGDNK